MPKTNVKKTTVKTPKTTTVKKATPKAALKKVSKTVKKSAKEIDILDIVKESLDDGKAEDIVVIDLKGKTDIADFMVVASGNSNRHVLSLAENLVTKLKKHKIVPKIEGKQQADWILVDAVNIIIHLFRPEVRQYYNIEKMWGIVSSMREESKAV